MSITLGPGRLISVNRNKPARVVRAWRGRRFVVTNKRFVGKVTSMTLTLKDPQ